MNISYSAVQDWRTCQQRYAYRYIEGLEAKVQDAAPTLGSILHDYLEHYYSAFFAGIKHPKPIKAHTEAVAYIREEWAAKLKGLAFAAHAADADGVAAEFTGMLDKAERIVDRYWENRGRADSTEHTVLLCEQAVEFPLTTSIITPLRVDLVTQDSAGLVWLWEHKSGKEIPPPQRRLKDLQTVLYAAIVEEAYGIKPDGVIWNYLRTKEPTVPVVLKSGKEKGQVTRKRDLDTTWEVYLAIIEEAGLDPLDYDDQRVRFENAEQTNFFPRHDLPLMQSEQVLLRDFVTSATQIKYAVEQGAGFIPVRNINYHCDWCPMRQLCQAVILGGDDTDLKARLFTKRQRREERDGNIYAITAT